MEMQRNRVIEAVYNEVVCKKGICDEGVVGMMPGRAKRCCVMRSHEEI